MGKIKNLKMKRRILILVIGILGIIISSYNTIAGESIKSNLVGFILGIGLILVYFETNKSNRTTK
jgi:Flp pilus assembly protein TadB